MSALVLEVETLFFATATNDLLWCHPGVYCDILTSPTCVDADALTEGRMRDGRIVRRENWRDLDRNGER